MCSPVWLIWSQTYFFPIENLASSWIIALIGYHLASTTFCVNKSPECSKRGSACPSLAIWLCLWYFSHEIISSWQAWHTYSTASKCYCCIYYINCKETHSTDAPKFIKLVILKTVGVFIVKSESRLWLIWMLTLQTFPSLDL